MKQRVILNLYGGIGNQLFQYCFARAYAAMFGCDIYVNKTGFEWQGGHGEFLLDGIAFNGMADRIIKGKLKAKVISGLLRYAKHGINLYEKSTFILSAKKGFCSTETHRVLVDNLSELQTEKKWIFIDGYFQWPCIMDEMIKYFQKNVIYKTQLNESNQDYLNKIKGCESVCLHVRRGDYLKYPSLMVCNLNYYMEAIRYVKQKVSMPIFFVFSDDIEWAKENIGGGQDFIYIVERNISSVELHLMSSCNHFIISNSTFSWWAQALAKNADKIVVAPSKWFTDGRQAEVYMDYFYRIAT